MFCIVFVCLFFFFKQKTAYEMRISDWSSDVCSSDLADDAIAIEYLADGTVWFTTLVYCSDELAVLQLDTVVRDYDAGKVNRLLVTGHEVVIACDISRAVATVAEEGAKRHVVVEAEERKSVVKGKSVAVR